MKQSNPTPLMFINVYEVSRHYGGPEEGGWWYDAGEPLASVPIKAEVRRGHPSYCHTCNQARSGAKDESGKAIEFCRKVTDENEAYAESLPEDQQDAYFASLPEESHLTPACEQEKNRKVAELEELFAGHAHGDINSVLGGEQIQVQVEEEMAYRWPHRKPRYE